MDRCIGWDTEVVTEDCMVSERCGEPATEAVRDTDLWFCERHMRLATDVYGWAKDHEGPRGEPGLGAGADVVGQGH